HEEPQKPRKLLVLSRAWGYKHSAIPYGAKAIKIMARKTDAFDAVVTREVDLIEPEKLKQFDAVFLNNCNNEIFLPSPDSLKKMSDAEKKKARKRARRLRASLRDFVRNGGGLGGLHAAVAAFREWPEYGDIIGARYDGHPWGSGSTVTVKVEEPNHPLVQAFDDTRFTLTDEIYQVKDPYSRDNLRVLLSLDTERTNMDVGGIHRDDKDFAMSWIKNYGSGRVFYFAPGHEHHIFWNPSLLKHLLDGIQFTLGDLPADTTPDAVERPRYSGDWEGVIKTDNEAFRAAAQFIGRGDGKYLVKVYEGTKTTGAPIAELDADISGKSITMESRTDADIRAEGTISKFRLEGSFTGDTEGTFWLNSVVNPSPTLGAEPPEDAVVLFDGTDTDMWKHPDGDECGWKLTTENAMQVVPDAGSVVSTKSFTDQRIHLEFATPYMPAARGQKRGNSGVYVQGLYEVQILDSYGLEPQNNRAGGIYGVSTPRVNACSPPGYWQTYDIEFHAPRFNDEGEKVEDARMTVWHNGGKVQDDVSIPKPTRASMDRDVRKPGPLYLQDHGSPVRYRNIWIKPLDGE
ncbi:MAG: family 16 glycoside hydrolase, partial [Planctomycetota bacterium]